MTFSDKEQKIRHYWLAAFFVLCAFDVFYFFKYALPSLQDYPVYLPIITATITLLCRAAVFWFAYHKNGTRWLTYTLWAFWIGIGYAILIYTLAQCSDNYFVQISTAGDRAGIEKVGIPLWIITQLFACGHMYLTMRLRRINRSHRNSTLIVG